MYLTILPIEGMTQFSSAGGGGCVAGLGGAPGGRGPGGGRYPGGGPRYRNGLLLQEPINIEY